MILRLKRFCAAPDGMGTFGKLTIDELADRSWLTVERPWKNNEPSISCIPTGIYRLRHGTFAAGGGYPDLEFVDVPGRSHIEIHAANVASELKGCIAPGKTINWSQWRVLRSREALREILDAIGTETDLVIEIAWGW